jgi:hypothetical protein
MAAAGVRMPMALTVKILTLTHTENEGGEMW